MKSNKKPSRRKPSVALSRKFTCSEQFMDQLRPPNSKLAPIIDRRRRSEQSPSNNELQNNVEGITMEDVAYLKEDETQQNIEHLLEKFGIPWIPEILKNHAFFKRVKKEFPDCLQEEINRLHYLEKVQPKIQPKKGFQKMHLSESDAIEMFAISGSIVSKDSPQVKSAEESNKVYRQSCFREKEDFEDRAAQTFHLNRKSTAMNTNRIDTAEMGTMCTPYTTFGVNEKGGCKHNDEIDNIEFLTKVAIMTEGCLLDVSVGSKLSRPTTIPKSTPFHDIMLLNEKHVFFNSNQVKKRLDILERAVQQNVYSQKQLRYRKATKSIENDDGGEPEIEPLFNMICDVVSNMRVTCLCWNKTNSDLLAVGYGNNNSEDNGVGYVLLWSTRMPSCPEKIFKTSSPVTAIDFSLEKPSLFAAGLHSGCIQLFDIAHKREILDSSFTPNRHMSPITEIQWVVDSHQGTNERIVTISTDGRILEWSMKKGFSISPLMSLKRKNVKRSHAKIPNLAMGMCLDFQKGSDASMIYVAGSDDGTLFRCLRSYTEQYLAKVTAHSYAVTKVKHSPFANNVILSSSADSTVKVWYIAPKKEEIKECITIRPANLLGAVNDIAWSPRRSTLLTLTAFDGRIEFWDFSISLLDPIISETARVATRLDAPGKSLRYERTALLFSPCGGILVAGDNKGVVKFYNVNNFVSHPDQEKDRLYEQLKKTNLSN